MKDRIATLTQDEIILELIKLLKQNNMPQEANHTFELCAYVDSLEKKLDFMAEELLNVKSQLKDMQEDTVFKNLKAQVQVAQEGLQQRCNIIKKQLLVVKDNIKFKASEIVMDFKRSGKSALNKISEIVGVKEKLTGIRINIRESIKDVSSTIAKIDAFGAGIREASQKTANTFRTFADKEEVDYSQKEKKISKTEIVKKPWLARKKILEVMELRLDAAIDKTENLSRDVEVNCMMKTFNSLMEKTHVKQMGTMVAEPNPKYGAEAFETYEKSEGKHQTFPVLKSSERLKDMKSR